jgi:tetratricopeptide (TPR) repeat protein
MSDTPDPAGTLDEEIKQIESLLNTDAAQAAERAEQVLAREPGHAIVTLLLAAARRFAGDAAGAVEVLEPMAESNPNLAAAHYQLGGAYSAAGRSKQAVKALRHAVALQPAMPGAWASLAAELRKMGDDVEANDVCTARIQLATRDPRLAQADAALREKRLDEANKLLRQHLDDDPTDVLAMQMLATVGMRVGQLVDAGMLLLRALELAPNYASARHDYALVLDAQMRRDDALREIEHALKFDPDNPHFRNAQAVLLDRVGEYDRAIDVYAGLLDENPEQPKIWTSYGHALRAAGRQDDSVAAYQKAIAYQPDCGEAWWGLADLKTYTLTADDVDTLRRQLDSSGLSDDDRTHLDFTLAKALEDAGDYAASFEHYAAGNRLHRETGPYDAAQMTEGVRRSKALFTPAFFADRADCGSKAQDPIFIVGMPRSGSTLVDQILSSHSAVEGTMELPDMLTIVRELGERGAGPGEWLYPEVLEKLGADDLLALGERYLASTRIYRKTDRPMFIDKMPNNFANVGLIQLLLPNARIVDARRHPAATCFSIFKQLFARGQAFAYDLDDLGRFYRDYVELMAHFDEVLPGRVHRVVYESLVDDTEAEIRSLLDYCGLPFEESCLRFHETERAVRTASSEQVRQPIYYSGVDHWRHFERWLDPLKQALGPVLDAYPEVPSFAPTHGD